MKRNKKGIAIEMSVVFMLVVFLLCVAILTMSMYVSNQSGKFVGDSRARAMFDEVGEKFLGLIRTDPEDVTADRLRSQIVGLDLSEDYEIMVYETSSHRFNLYIYDTAHKENVLVVTAEYNAETEDCDILQWSYNS